MLNWILATRPKTLAAGIIPVCVGTALPWAYFPEYTRYPLAAVACLIGALFIQIACNFANDAVDGIKGTDNEDRLGPERMVSSGKISAKAMLRATWLSLFLAFLVGCYLFTFGGLIIFVLGIISLICAYIYTGGPYPLAYKGLGDIFVLLFFGFFATLGSAWVQCGPNLEEYAAAYEKARGVAPPLRNTLAVLHSSWWCIAAAVGLQATGILAVNNYRDREGDALSGKRTLAVRLPKHVYQLYFLALHLLACIALSIAVYSPKFTNPSYTPFWAFTLPAILAGIGGFSIWLLLIKREGKALNPLLGLSALLQLSTGASIITVLFW